MSLPPGSALAIGVLAVAVAFAVFCLTDLARAGQVRYLPKWVWALLICAMIPWGGLAYLIAGRARTPPGTDVKVPAAAPGVMSSGPRVPRRASVSPVVVEVDRLTKRFGPVTAVDGLTLEGDGGFTATGLDAPAIGDLAAGHGIAVHELVPRHASLEQAYLDLTSTSTDHHTRTPAPERTAVS